MFYMYECKLLKKLYHLLRHSWDGRKFFSLWLAIGCPTEPLKVCWNTCTRYWRNFSIIILTHKKTPECGTTNHDKNWWRQILGLKKPSPNKTKLHQPKPKAFEDVYFPPRNGAEGRILHTNRFFNTTQWFKK